MFRTIESVLMLARLFAIIYFLKQARTYHRVKAAQRDRYTSATFLLLGISLSCFFLNRASQLVENFLHSVFQEDPDTDRQITDWFNRYEFEIRLIRAFMRAGFGYLLQTLAFLVNIQRWSILLSGGSTITQPSQSD